MLKRRRAAFGAVVVVMVSGLAFHWYSGGRTARSDSYRENRLGLPIVDSSDAVAKHRQSKAPTAGAKVPHAQRDRDRGRVQPIQQEVRESEHRDQVKYISRKPTNLTARLLGNSSLNVEVASILSRIDTCLVATNMSDYFKKKGYYSTAKENAESVLRALRKIIPEFETPYNVPCWRTPFKALRETVSRKYLLKYMATRKWPKQNTISGYIGSFNFSYGENDNTHHKDILDNVQWTGKLAPQFKHSVACLPKIFLLGYPKCGSTFLYCLLRRILKLLADEGNSCEATKEPHWWVIPGPRDEIQSRSPDYLALYLLNFAKGAEYVKTSLPAVTIDASPNLMFQWPRYTEAETMENYCLIPSLVPVLLPDSKYIVVMRNPVSMLYSAFWFSCTSTHQLLKSMKYMGPDIFHERITRKIEIFNQCKAAGEPLDKCMDAVANNIYGPDFPMCGRTRLEMGLYYVHARKWLSVVPRERILFFTLEELAIQDLKHSAKVIVDFLEIDSGDLKMHNLLDIHCNKNQQKGIDYKHNPRLVIRNDTRQILIDFFKPYNQMLANLLGDDKFLWNDDRH